MTTRYAQHLMALYPELRPVDRCVNCGDRTATTCLDHHPLCQPCAADAPCEACLECAADAVRELRR